MTEKSQRWRDKIPFTQYRALEEAIAEAKPIQSFAVHGTKGFAKRASDAARQAKALKVILQRLP